MYIWWNFDVPHSMNLYWENPLEINHSIKRANCINATRFKLPKKRVLTLTQTNCLSNM
jgi:hypothetical protein